jgi:hypothetical protein
MPALPALNSRRASKECSTRLKRRNKDISKEWKKSEERSWTASFSSNQLLVMHNWLLLKSISYWQLIITARVVYKDQ